MPVLIKCADMPIQHPHRPLDILIVAPTAENCAKIRQFLTQDSEVDYTIHEATNADVGIAQCRALEDRPMLVLLDETLPNNDLEHLRQALDPIERPVYTPVIVLTDPSRAQPWPKWDLMALDLISKTDLNATFLTRVIRHSWQRFERLSRLHHREQRYRAGYDSASDFAIMLLDQQGRFTGWNTGAEKIFGYRENEIVGEPVTIIFTADDNDDERAFDEMALALERGQAIDTRWHRRKDGSQLWASGSMTPLRDAQHQTIGFIKIVQDRTEAKQAEEALKHAQAQADAANQSKSEFLANMSHEIRSPMTAILGYVDLLIARVNDHEAIEHLDVIRRNGRFLLEIINDILDLAKIEAGQLPLEKKTCAVDDIIAEVRSLMAVRAQEKQVPLLVDYASPIPAMIETDPVRLRQILINLVGNAIKFTDSGSVRLVVGFLPTPIPVLQFDVIDTGIGIDQADHERLFQPFSQADASRTRRFGGTGLGLTISQRCAELLGGKITVSSQLSQGSTFTLTVTPGDVTDVPLIEPGEAVVVQPRAADPLPPLEGRVLVVDDQADIRKLVQHHIKTAGGEVETAENGQSALDQIECTDSENRSFDLIVMDMQMPEMDGFQTVATLRARGWHKPIIALTAGAMLGEREKCLEVGCDDYLSKPADRHVLIEMISRHLARTARPVTPQSSNRCVLLVEDNKDAREATARLLSLAGHQVVTAADGQSAIAVATTTPPDVVLLDIGLPDMDGYAVLRELKTRRELQQTVFIALSGYDNTDQKTSGETFDHYVAKPVELSELLALFP